MYYETYYKQVLMYIHICAVKNNLIHYLEDCLHIHHQVRDVHLQDHRVVVDSLLMSYWPSHTATGYLKNKDKIYGKLRLELLACSSHTGPYIPLQATCKTETSMVNSDYNYWPAQVILAFTYHPRLSAKQTRCMVNSD